MFVGLTDVRGKTTRRTVEKKNRKNAIIFVEAEKILLEVKTCYHLYATF